VDFAVPLISVFTDDTSSLSEVRVSRLLRFHIEHGAKGFVFGGLTSETFMLGHNERKQFLEWAIRESQGLPIWVDVTAMTTSGVLDLCQHASRHGARGALLSPPPFGRFYAHEVKALMTAMNRHGNLATEFVDPEGKWEGFGELPLKAAKSVDVAMAVFDRPSVDEMQVGGLVASPFAMFGADKAPALIEKADVFRPAMQALVRHGGVNRAARAALVARDCELGPARSPVFELSDEGRKILNGIVAAVGS
jgi:dihydrodipicolinate synthase/N-acetylneuraminate lyase